MDARRIEFQAGSLVRNQKSRRHPCIEFHIADPHPREANAAEVVYPLDIGGQQVRRGRRDGHEFRADADLDVRACRQVIVAAVQRDLMTADTRFASCTPAGTMFIPGEPMK